MKRAVIIGGGPAGLTAGIYLARADVKPLILAGEKAGGQLMLTTEVENFPGIPEGTMGPDLMMRMREQAENFGAKILNENVTEVMFGEKKVIRTSKEEFEAEAVILAMGAKAKMLSIGEEKYYGRGLSTCAVCDAAFFRGKRVAVVGGGDAAMEDVLALTKFAESIDIIHRRDVFRASKIMQERVLSNNKVNVMWDSEIIKVIGELKIESVIVKNNKSGNEFEMQLDGLFLAIGHEPETEILKGKAELDEKGYLKVGMDESFPTMTSVAGVFGAGDLVDFRYKQAISAAGMGCQAALDAERYVESH